MNSYSTAWPTEHTTDIKPDSLGSLASKDITMFFSRAPTLYWLQINCNNVHQFISNRYEFPTKIPRYPSLSKFRRTTLAHPSKVQIISSSKTVNFSSKHVNSEQSIKTSNRTASTVLNQFRYGPNSSPTNQSNEHQRGGDHRSLNPIPMISDMLSYLAGCI